MYRLKKNDRRVHLYYLIPCLLLTATASAATAEDARSTNIPLSAISVPSELGSISQLFEVPQATSTTRLVLLIQDAHVNYEGQKHYAAILDRFASEQGLRLILVEGGSGDVGLANLRQHRTKEGRRSFAERMLKEGIFAGHEYLDVASDHPLILWGIEDPTRYEGNLRQFLIVEKMQPVVLPALENLNQVVESLKLRYYNNDLKTLAIEKQAYQQEKRSLDDYVRYLAGLMERAGMEKKDFPNLDRYLRSNELQKSLDMKAVGQDQRAAVQKLQPALAAEELARLTEAANQSKQGKISQHQFYFQLRLLMEAKGVASKDFPNLDDYFHYLEARAAMDFRGMLSELSRVPRVLAAALAKSDEEKRLVEIADGLDALDRLIRLKWVPEDVERFRESREQWKVANWMLFLQEQTAKAGETFSIDFVPGDLDDAVNAALGFYEAARDRDEEMVRRSIEKMDQSGERIAALILGGFHTEHISQLLVEQGIQVAVITPRTGSEDNEAKYHLMLKLKYPSLEPEGGQP